MGSHELQSLQNVWSTDPDLFFPFVSCALSKNCSAQILSHIHVNDNTAISDNSEDKLYKLRPLINKLNKNFVKIYNISNCASVNESIILFNERSSLRQYNPIKPIKRGYKQKWMVICFI